MNWETYTAFGDSITIGARSYLGYPEVTGSILEQHLSKKWNITNCAVSGITAIELARIIDKEFTNLNDKQSSISTILIGTNDIKKETSTKEFEIALNLVVVKTKLLTQNENVIVIQIPNLQKGIMYPYNIKMNQRVLEFNKSIVKIAKHNKVNCIKLQVDETHFIDGVHLCKKGVFEVGKQIANYILEERGLINDQLV